MGKTAVIEERPVQPEAESAEITCQHHWVIETPRGSMSQGRCKRCGEQREFRNSAHDHLWEDDSGGGYNPWRGSRPTRGPADDDEVAASSGGGAKQALIA
jgi:hypothetical protein